MIENLEDCLETLIGFKSHPYRFKILKEDYSVFHSIAKQIGKGMGLTDRQKDLLIRRFDDYTDQFCEAGISIFDFENKLRIPLRQIDRSQWIKITEEKNQKYISIRFPFKKKLILLINELKLEIPHDEYIHVKGTHKHLFLLSEINLFLIIKKFKNKHFDIDKKLLDCFDLLVNMQNTSENYIPGIYNYRIKNLHNDLKTIAVKELGHPTKSNLAIYNDRKRLYGLKHFDKLALQESLLELSTLASKISTRQTKKVFINSKNYNLENVILSIYELKRFPLLIALPTSKEYEYLKSTYEVLKNIINYQDISVIFRLDNKGSDNISFNSYIQQNKLNSPVAENTKIVYTNTSKITKPLLTSNWNPIAAIFLDSTRTAFGSNINTYLNCCDLIIQYDEIISPFYKVRSGGVDEF